MTLCQKEWENSFKVLESVLRPLSYWYNQDNIEEVAINNAGMIWLRLRGKRAYPWVMYKDEKLTKEYLTDLLYIVANTYELPFDPVAGSPVVYATIPGDHRKRRVELASYDHQKPRRRNRSVGKRACQIQKESCKNKQEVKTGTSPFPNKESAKFQHFAFLK